MKGENAGPPPQVRVENSTLGFLNQQLPKLYSFYFGKQIIKILCPYLVFDSDETIIQPIFFATVNKTFDLQELKNVLDTVLEFDRRENNILIDKLISFRW